MLPTSMTPGRDRGHKDLDSGSAPVAALLSPPTVPGALPRPKKERSPAFTAHLLYAAPWALSSAPGHR